MTSIAFGNNNCGFQVGHSSGSIHAEIHLPPEPVEARPAPLSTVPFLHDPDFVSRGTLLDKIHEKVSVVGSRIVLIGLGGVGKTRLAIEYCHRVRAQSTDTWVLWVHASNAARCEKSLRDLADRAEIPGRLDHKINIFQLVGNWLRDKNIGKWLLVLDNVDDHELLRIPSATSTGTQPNTQNHTPTQPPLRYLLECSNGSILITSRNKGVALGITDHQKDIIDVQPMNQAEALVLLQKKLDIYTESAEMVQLVEELEFMPLAIVQAASYIVHYSPRCSVPQYLEKLRKSDRQATRLLNREAGHIHRDWEAKNSILLTWQISFEHIRRMRQSAADLLSLMSFFDSQGIPEDLLRVHDRDRNFNDSRILEEVANSSSEDEADCSSKSDLSSDFEDDIATLRDYSFIYVGDESTVFTMHRLVQLTVRAWLKYHGQMEQWKEQFISILCEHFPHSEYENWRRCRQLFPHVKSAMSHRPGSQGSQQEWATLLDGGALYASQMGNVSDARAMASKSREQKVVIFGVDGEETIDSTAMLANVYWLEGRWDEAEKLHAQVMKTCKMKLGDNHPDTLRSMDNLVLIYSYQGRWEEVEKLQAEMVEISKTKLDDDHPDTLRSMDDMAFTYTNQGRWEEAEKLQAKVVETSKSKLGDDHPDTLRNLNNLALIYSYQGRWEKAEKLQAHVVEMRKAKLGDDHRDTMGSMNNLGLIYWNQKRWEAAEQLQEEVMEMFKFTLGEDHPYTLKSVANLVPTYRNQGRWEEAEKLQAHVVEVRMTKLGDDHPDTLRSMDDMALTYTNQGRWEEAEKLQAKVVETSKTKLGDDHPDTLRSMNNLALIYSYQGRWEKAEKLQAHVVEMRKTKLGDDHPDTVKGLANLASTFWNQSRWEEAEKLRAHVVEMRKTMLGDEHPDILRGMENLALSYSDQTCWEDIEPRWWSRA